MRCPNWPDKKNQCEGELITVQVGTWLVSTCSSKLCTYRTMERSGANTDQKCTLCNGPMYVTGGVLFCGNTECPNYHPFKESA